MIPPISGSRSTRWTRRKPRFASTIAHSIPARSGADDQDVAVGIGRALEPLGIPASSVLLAGRRILRAAEVMPGLRFRDADIAADAFADVVVAPLLDLAGQERVGNRGPRGADQVHGAARDELRHAIGVGEPSDADDRLGGRLAHAGSPFELESLGEEARRARVVRPEGDRADVDVPEIDERVGEPDECERLFDVEAGRQIDADPHDDRRCVSDCRSDELERLEPHPRAVLERAAVRVRPPVRERTRETGSGGSCALRTRRRGRIPPSRPSWQPRPSPTGRGGCRRAPSPSGR